MKKQILLLVFMLSVAASTFAVEAEIDGLWYELVSDTKEAIIIQYKNHVKYNGDIVIPETVEYEGTDYSVTSIRGYAFYECSGLVSVTIGNNVTSIGYAAFAYCGLTSVTIPNSVTSLEEGAFFDCNGLTSVTIPVSVTSIEKYAFQGCSALTSVTIPNSVTSIAERAFCGCSGLTSVTIPNSVTSIGNEAFQNCTGLTSVTIDNCVTSIGQYAFYGCSGLTSINIPNSLKSIESGTFRDCSGLTSITIPNSVASIGNSAFYGCSGLTSITIGSGVNTIKSGAFAWCSELTDVYCYAEAVPSTNTDAFGSSFIKNPTLHVPTSSIDVYKAVTPWSLFKTIVGLDGTMPETPKCATPTIALVDGKLKFSCETEGVEYVSEVTVADAKKNYSSEVSLTGIYTVSVYATKMGYDNSDVSTLEFTLDAGGEPCDVNKDGQVDVADIATIISRMVEK